MVPFFLKAHKLFPVFFYLSINAVIGQSITPPLPADMPTGIASFPMTTATTQYSLSGFDPTTEYRNLY